MPILTNEQRLNSNNGRKTKSLFKEYNLPGIEPVFTLVDNPVETNHCIPLKPIYLSLTLNDPTEYDFAMEVFGEWKHWKQITETKWMNIYLVDWREEAEVLRKKMAFQAILEEAQGGRSKFSASKYLIEEPWKDKRNPKTKKANQKTSSKASESVAADVKRLQDYL